MTGPDVPDSIVYNVASDAAVTMRLPAGNCKKLVQSSRQTNMLRTRYLSRTPYLFVDQVIGIILVVVLAIGGQRAGQRLGSLAVPVGHALT